MKHRISTSVLCACVIGLGFAGSTAAQPGRSVKVDVDMGKTYQTIEGFGTCYEDWSRIPAQYSDPAFLDRIVNDLGVSLMRQQMADEMEWKNDDGDAGKFNWPGYHTGDVGRTPGSASRMKFFEDLKKQGVKHFFMSPWSPPPWMKTNRNARWGGQLRMDMVDEYAEFMAANIILAKKNHGIDIGAITVQNEMLFVESYHSCLYNAWVLREAVRALMHRFEKEGITTRIFMPEDMMFFDRMTQYIAPTMADPETRNFPGGFATHRQEGLETLKKWTDAVAPYGREFWMTETSGHAQTWPGALQMAGDMQDYLVGGNCSAWTYWQITGTDMGLIGRGESPKYYAAKHFYRYIRPGAVRVDSASSDADFQASAFRHDVDGTLTIVLVNKGETAGTIAVNAGKGPVAQYHVYRSSSTENCLDQGTLEAGKPVEMAPQSIVTLVGQSDALKTKAAIDEWPESWKAPAGTEGQVWGNAEPREWTEGDALCMATMNGAVDAVKKAIADGKQNSQNAFGWTPLHMAILTANLAEIEVLLAGGADVNRAANDGWTPAHAAAASFGFQTDRATGKRTGKYDAFKLIMAAKPDLKAKTTDGWTALHAAVANAHVAWQEDPTDNTNRIRDLIAAGVDLEAGDANGRTALHWACWQGFDLLKNQDDIVQALLQAKANVNAVDKTGRTPLHYAAEQGFAAIASALVKAQAKTDVKDNAGKTPADLAKARGLDAMLPILAGASAASAGDGAAKPAAQAGKLGPELIRAAREGDLQKVKDLVAQGADVLYADSDGFRAADRARDNGHSDVAKFLKDEEAKRARP